MARYGRCQAINLGNKKQCLNPATGNGFCYHPKHQSMYGIGVYTEQLEEIRDYGPPSDPNCPVGNVKLTVAHIKAQLSASKPSDINLSRVANGRLTTNH